MSRVRCKDCQYFDGVSKCERYENLKKRNIYDECIEYERTTNYYRSNHRDSIENIVNDLVNLVEEENALYNQKKIIN